jgi:gamma-glutamylputrescine oxidase
VTTSSLSPNTPSATNNPVWDDGQWQSFPLLDGDVTCDTCVIGLGGSGLTAIGELVARGEDVVGIDAIDVGAGAAGRNGGFLLAGAYDFYHDAVRLHGAKQARAIYEATLQELQRIAEATPDCVQFVGSRRLAANEWEIADCREQMRVMQNDGLQVEWYDGPDGIGLTLASDAACNPLVRCRTLALSMRARGARLFSRTPVTNVAEGLVSTATGSIRCKRVIVAIDGKLEVLLPELQGRVRTTRLQMLATAPTTERIVPCPMYYREGFEYWQQLPNGSIALGGFRDKSYDTEWTTDTRPADPIQSMLETFMREHLGVDAPITHRWAASAGYASTGLPIVEEIRKGVWVIGGYSGTGNVIGALCGRAIVALALDGDGTKASVLIPNASKV